ncbi:protein spaetzle 4 [Microplitis mediator]|uniref:protein spaetzle 4 n=1 Tax=Microplitis mediator TaxID=375433 RepID=UPI0025548CA0|nr:protein spaetzle 4 [Microplitis mediator]
MSALSLFILQMVITPFAVSQFSESSYSNSFGYDASSSCSKPFTRNSKVYFEKLPCDFQSQNWCTVAGKYYPWHAVKRFVQENQGLMRRMYGDEKHIIVLKSELEKNDIDFEFDDRYQKHFNSPRGFLHDNDYNHEENDHKIPRYKNQETKFMEKLPKFRDFTKLHPQFTVTPTYTSTKTVSSKENLFNISSNLSTKLFKATVMDKSTEELQKNDSIKTNENKKNVNSNATVLLSDLARVQNSSVHGTSDLSSTTENNLLNLTTINPFSTEATEKTTSDPESFPHTSTTKSDQIVPITERNDKDEMLTNEQNQQSFKPHPDHNLSENKPNNPNIEGQLFQDATKEQTERPVLKLRGINACPVKEEVVAPFWANNTRGEVLALLNLYPFEQYVHWEKCTHEKKQMYCREGCRCEQQYRLHRLLAYDPNNECRGIFSDWFKFPSCCVCRCYDLPIEFRVTSRSPRAQRQKLNLRKSMDLI